MKKLLLILIIINCQLSIVNSFAQIPQSFKYQAVVRDAAGVLSVNKIISIKTSILSGTATGIAVYTETQTLSTNEYGVVALNIGAGTLVSGNFSTINWGTTTYFVKTELDINGGTTYVFMGTSQILSVPYALYAEKTGSSLSDHDTSATNELQTLSISGNNLVISGGNTVALPPDTDNDPLNEIQNLSVIGHTINISGGNVTMLPPDTLSINGNMLGISNGNVISLPPDSDSNPTNEYQNLSLVGDSLRITNGNSVYLSGSLDLDASPTNEIQSLYINSDTLGISNGNFVIIPQDNDSDSTNEIQTINLNQGTLSITKGNSIILPDSSSINELQNLAISHDSISISQKNTIYINTTRSIAFPEGTDGQPFTLSSNSNTTYTVPTGKNLYLINGLSNLAPQGRAVFLEGAVIPFTSGYSYGILANKNSDIQVVNFTINDSGLTYTVPSGKYLYVISSNNSSAYQVLISGITSFANGPGQLALILPPGSVLSYPPSSGSCFITGYLK